MSYKLGKEIFHATHVQLTTQALTVLLAYADHVNANANDELLISHPSQETIMAMCRIRNKRTMKLAMTQLQDKKFLIPTDKRFGESGRVREYRINIAEIRKSNGGNIAPIKDDVIGAVLPFNGGNIAPRIDKGIDKGIDNIVASKKNDATRTDNFLRFWNSYPRKENKKGACKAFQKIKAVEMDEILKAIELQKKSEQWQKPQFIPLASTWLNNERWKDSKNLFANQGMSNVHWV